MKRLGNKSMIENGLTLVHVVFYIIVCVCTLVIHQGLEVNFLCITCYRVASSEHNYCYRERSYIPGT